MRATAHAARLATRRAVATVVLPVTVTLLASLMWLVAACGSGSHTPTSPSRSASGSGSPAPAALNAGQRRSLAAAYLAIAGPANQRLDGAVDRFREDKQGNLSAAKADLIDQATIERQWDREFARIDFPPQLKVVATRLLTANEARARLALAGSMARSLTAITPLASQQPATDARVEQQVRIIRQALGLPPPDES